MQHVDYFLSARANEHQGAIASWADSEAYDWPRVKGFDFSRFEYLTAHLPDGMGPKPAHAGGVFEWATWIISYEGPSYGSVTYFAYQSLITITGQELAQDAT